MAVRLRPSHRLGRRRERTRPALSDGRARPTLPWLADSAPVVELDTSVLERPVVDAARALLGCRLESTVGGERTVGVIVEAEAYDGPDDPASHAATAAGVTSRNRAMFGPAGRAYVYRSYGVHWCMNVVTGRPGQGQAVLIRALDPLEGLETMSRRRGRLPLCAGPGRLCQALAVTEAVYGHDLRRPPLRLLGGWPLPDELVGVSGRVGVSAAADRPYRFYVRGSSGVSRPDGWTPT